jgi:hypothetical protein
MGVKFMANLGGYFAVSYLAEHVLIDALDNAYRGNWRDAAGKAQWSADTSFGRLDAEGAVSVDKPGMKLSGATNAVLLKLSGRGRFDLTLNGALGGGVFIEALANVSVPIRISQEASFQKAVVDLTGIILDIADLQLTWFDNPPDGKSEAAVLSVNARKALADELVRRAEPFLTFRLPTDQLFYAELAVATQGIPGSVIILPDIKLGSPRVLDGWLAVGVDNADATAESHGDSLNIGLPPEPPLRSGKTDLPEVEEGDNSLRLVIDPSLLRNYLVENAKFAVIFATAAHPNIHPDLDNIGISFDDDTLVVHASGSIDRPNPFPGESSFTADVGIRPFIPKNAGAIYARINPDIRVDVPWYLEVLGSLIQLFGVDVYAKLNRANQSSLAILFGVKIREKVPGFDGLDVGIEARRLWLRPDLVAFYGVADTGATSELPKDLTPNVWADGWIWIRDRFLRLQLDPFRPNRLAADPTFRIRYRIRRGSDGTEVDAGAVWATPDPFGGPVDLWEPANYLETAFEVDLVAEQPPGHSIASVTQTIPVGDLFDRAHPFARWRKTHIFVQRVGAQTIEQRTTRLSAIHRTAIRERCEFCDTGTHRDKKTYVVEAIDTLPPPNEDEFSNRLCQYCFSKK